MLFKAFLVLVSVSLRHIFDQHPQQANFRPDCVTEVRMGNTGLPVFGYFKWNDGYSLLERRTRKYPTQ